MFGTRGKSKPKDIHSLENLKYLYTILVRHQAVTESNRSLLVETLRSISEILIWGDQNDGTVFDYFLEKGMLAFFLQYVEQEAGCFISVQLLQTLNILFDNISSETSIYYLLSNNQVNAIIKHQFNFDDEEVMAYYISFLKTISLKLNKHTIHFFFNEQSCDFPLYTEALKFFNHKESMVRIAVRTITLNVFKINDPKMHRFIMEQTAESYFSELLRYMCKHLLNLDRCIRNDVDHKNKDRLGDYIAEHLDHIHYLNDVLCTNCGSLSDILTDLLLDKMFVPFYINGLLDKSPQRNTETSISQPLAIFLLSQVLLIMKHPPLIQRFFSILLGPIRTSDVELSSTDKGDNEQTISSRQIGTASDGEAESNSTFYVDHDQTELPNNLNQPIESLSLPDSTTQEAELSVALEAVPTTHRSPEVEPADTAQEVEPDIATVKNITDDEKITGEETFTVEGTEVPLRRFASGSQSRPYLKSLSSALQVTDSDYMRLLATCCLYGLIETDGAINKLNQADGTLVLEFTDRLINTISQCADHVANVRLCTLGLTIMTLKVIIKDGVTDEQIATILSIQEKIMEKLRKLVKTEEMFLEIFEHEFRQVTKRSINVEYLMMDSTVLLEPTSTPLTGIDLDKRYPCGDVEKVRCTIKTFLNIWLLIKHINNDVSALPLIGQTDEMRIGDVRDLNNSDLVGCLVIKDNTPQRKERQFLVIDTLQIILVEPDGSKLGWGVVKFCGYLQDVEVLGDKYDSRTLHITVHKQPTSHLATKAIPLLSAKLIFDDHIRCMAAKQRLTKGRVKARQKKMTVIYQMLDMSNTELSSLHSQSNSLFSSIGAPVPGKPVAARQLVNRVPAPNPARNHPDCKESVLPSRVARVLNQTRKSPSSSSPNTQEDTVNSSAEPSTMSIQLKELRASKPTTDNATQQTELTD